LHLENFGTYKGDNRLVYFDLNDFDEACVAPAAWELIRFASGLLSAAPTLGISPTFANELANDFLHQYASELRTTKARWVERATAEGPVRTLLQSLKRCHRDELIRKRTERVKGKTRLIVDGVHALAVTKNQRQRAESILAAYSRSVQRPARFFEPIDIARRIAGNGSLGLERYIALVRGDRGPSGAYLLDIKLANPSALEPHTKTAQVPWQDEAARVIACQRIAQAIPPALLGRVKIGKRAYVIKELQPTDARLSLNKLDGRGLERAVKTLAHVTAWAQLRGASRLGADSIEALANFANNTRWIPAILASAEDQYKKNETAWRQFREDVKTYANHFF
jgi:uncharacterized protein (DUF2252 family)